MSEFFLQLSDALRLLTDTAAIKQTSLQLLRTHLGVPRALYAEALGQDGTLRVIAESVESVLTPLAGQVLRSADFTPAALMGRPVWRDDVLQGDHSSERQAGHTALGTRAWAMVPLVKDGRLVAAFTVYAPEVRRWTPEDISVMQETAERTWAAVERVCAEEALRESEEKYRKIFENIDQGFSLHELVIDESGHVTDVILREVNEAFEHHTGIKNAQGKKVSEIVPHLEPVWLDAMTRAYQWGETQHFEAYNVDTDRWITSQYSRIGGAGSRLLSTVFTDVTERKQREQHQEFLLMLSDALRSVGDSTAMERAAMQAMGETLGADRVFLATVQADGTSWSVREEYAPGLPSGIGSFPMSEFQRGRLPQWQAGQMSSVTDSETDPVFSAADRAAYAAFGLRAAIGVPLVKEGRFTALLCVNQATPRHWTAAELALTSEAAERIWVALERARLERARAEEAVRESEEQRELALEATQLGTFVWNIQEDRSEADGRMMELLDQQPGGLSLGEALATMIHPADAQRYATAVAAAIRPDGPRTLSEDVRMRRADGSWRWIAITGKTSFGEAGQPLRMYGTALDITERKQYEETLRESEERQAFLLRLSDALRLEVNERAVALTSVRLLADHLRLDRAYVAQVDKDRDRAEIGPEYRRPDLGAVEGFLTLSEFPEAFARVEAATLVLADTAADPALSELDRAGFAALRMGALIVASARKGERNPVWALLVAVEGPRHWTAAEVTLVEEVAERTWAATQRARAEEAVRFSETRFIAMANLVPDLLWESQPDGLATWYNQRWLEYTGQTVEQATGWGWTDTVHPEDREASSRRYREAVDAGLPLRQEHRMRRHDGEYRWFAVSTFPLRDARGQVIKIYGAATDIHDLRALNATLEERVNERTRRLDELNSELAARTRALETFSQLTHTLALETDRYVLIQHVQRVLLSLLPPAHTGYFELEAGLWHMKSEVGDPGSEALRAWLKAGIPPESPGPSVPFLSGRPEYLDALPPGQDVPAELSSHIRTTAALPVVLSGTPIGVLAVGRFDTQPWQPADKIVLETAVQALVLALERAEAIRALAEEREALAAFAHFSARTANTHDVGSLAQQAAEVLRATLNVTSAVYFELRDGNWKALWISGSADSAMEVRFYNGIPDSTPSFEQPVTRREPMFFEGWDAVADGLPEGNAYRAVARYPLFPQDHPVGMLEMATTESDTWTDREKAVFRAVGDSFRLALERLATTQQIERQRQRLADLNAELGSLITRTAYNLEAPSQQFGELLGSDRANELQTLWERTYDPVVLKDEVARLRGVAQDLRQLSVIEEQPLDKEPLPLGELFIEVSTTPPGGQVTWSIQALPIVRGNRALLRQALDVLMTFTLSPTRGTRYVTVSSRQIEGEVQVTVQDDGPGLDGEEAATLFDLAVRTEHPVPVLEGSGLIQVRRILARHGGWAWAESQLSSGKIVLAFPRDEAVNELESLFRQDKPGMG